MKIVKSSRKAISPLLATIILIAITIVGGLVVYSIFTSSAGTAGSQSSLQVVSDQLVVPTGGGSATWAITVKNQGNKPIQAMSVTLGTTTVTTLTGCSSSGLVLTPPGSCPVGSTTINLAPGQSIAGSTSVSGITVGQTYSVTVTATFVGGSTSTNVFTVQATSS
jgi:flagellin-like protein